MTRSFTFLTLSVFSTFFFFSCTHQSTCSCDPAVGNWVKRADFNGVGRSEAISFVVGDSAYVGTGYDGTNRLNDLWEYNVVVGAWSQKASLPGDARSSAVGFSTSTKGYVATGSSGPGFNGTSKLKDTWEYDPVQNTWTRKADFGGTARVDAVGFGINDKGYITTGNDGSDLKDLWMFDPAANSWVQKADLAGLPREAAVGLVYKNQAYIVTGTNAGATINDFWMYDPATDKWTAKRPITNVSKDKYDDAYGTTLIVRSNAAAFTINDYAYVCTGTGQNGNVLRTVWQYNFATDLWNQTQSWEGVEITGAVAFTIGGRALLGTGRNSTYEFDDFKEFYPLQAYNVND